MYKNATLEINLSNFKHYRKLIGEYKKSLQLR